MKRISVNPVGQTYGCWTVLEEVSRLPNGKRQFLCRCKCGHEKIKLASNFTYKLSSHCRECSRAEPVGQTFGYWLVLEEMEKGKYTRLFLCRCQKCGREKVLPMSNLVYGNSTQCQSCNAKELWAQGKIHGPSPKKFNGKTVKEWEEITGFKDVRRRISNGIPPDAPKYSMGVKRIRTLKYNGIVKNMAQWARVFGISRERVRQLIDLEGKTIGELVERYGEIA